MLLDNWNVLAIGFAAYMREFRPHVHRGALAIRQKQMDKVLCPPSVEWRTILNTEAAVL